MRVAWTEFRSGERCVEGQVFSPETQTQKAILFCPGFPGAGATVFEQRHAATLVDEGYAVIVLRHCGTRLDGPFAPMMVNNALRLLQARRNSQTHLGGGPSSVGSWLMEPYSALECLHNQFESISVIGNSFGALSALWSMTEANAPVGKVTHLLLQAGAQGVDDGSPQSVMRIWKPEYIGVPRITEKVTLESPEQSADAIGRCYRSLPERVRTNLSVSIRLTYLVVKQDELLWRSDTEAFRTAIGGRGDVVIDGIDRPHPDAGLMAHDMPDYPTENLLEFLRG